VSAFAAVLALTAGLVGSMQVAVMARLGERIGTFEALAFAGLVTTVVASAALLVVRQSWSGYAAALRQPAWLWLGGVMGAFIVLVITIAGSRLGTAATVAMLITGNLTMAILIDRFGWFGIERIPLHLQRVVGIVLLAAGAALTLKK